MRTKGTAMSNLRNFLQTITETHPTEGIQKRIRLGATVTHSPLHSAKIFLRMSEVDPHQGDVGSTIYVQTTSQELTDYALMLIEAALYAKEHEKSIGLRQTAALKMFLQQELPSKGGP